MTKFIRTREVAELTGYSDEVIRKFVREGELKAYRRKKNTDYRYLLSDIEAFMLGKKPGSKKKRPVKKKAL